MKTPIIFDGRNCYDIDLVEEYNIDYYSIGRSEILNINKEIQLIAKKIEICNTINYKKNRKIW